MAEPSPQPDTTARTAPQAPSQEEQKAMHAVRAELNTTHERLRASGAELSQSQAALGQSRATLAQMQASLTQTQAELGQARGGFTASQDELQTLRTQVRGLTAARDVPQPQPQTVSASISATVQPQAQAVQQLTTPTGQPSVAAAGTPSGPSANVLFLHWQNTHLQAEVKHMQQQLTAVRGEAQNQLLKTHMAEQTSALLSERLGHLEVDLGMNIALGGSVPGAASGSSGGMPGVGALGAGASGGGLPGGATFGGGAFGNAVLGGMPGGGHGQWTAAQVIGMNGFAAGPAATGEPAGPFAIPEMAHASPQLRAVLAQHAANFASPGAVPGVFDRR